MERNDIMSRRTPRVVDDLTRLRSELNGLTTREGTGARTPHRFQLFRGVTGLSSSSILPVAIGILLAVAVAKMAPAGAASRGASRMEDQEDPLFQPL